MIPSSVPQRTFFLDFGTYAALGMRHIFVWACAHRAIFSALRVEPPLSLSHTAFLRATPSVDTHIFRAKNAPDFRSRRNEYSVCVRREI